MRTSYFPSTDLGLLGWAKNFSQRISAAGPALGLSLQQTQDFAALVAAYGDAMQKVEPTVRSRSTVIGKNDCREAMKANARLLVSIINGQSGVSDQQKTELGMSVRKQKSPIPR